MSLKKKNFKAWRMCHNARGKNKKGYWDEFTAMKKAIVHGKDYYRCTNKHHEGIFHLGGERDWSKELLGITE